MKNIIAFVLFMLSIIKLEAQSCTNLYGEITQNTVAANCYKLPDSDTINMCFTFTAPGSILLFTSAPHGTCSTLSITANLYDASCNLVQPNAYGIVFTTIGEDYTWCQRYICTGAHDSVYCPQYIDFSNPLPVTWLDFTALQVNDSVRLNWATASETGSDYFSVQRSGNDIQFKDLHFVPGAGYSTIQHYYSFTDKPQDPFNIYRIKANYKDGSYDYSNIVVVKKQTDDKRPVSLFDMYGRLVGTVEDRKRLQPGVYILSDGFKKRKIVK